jgi:hypothetical protein
MDIENDVPIEDGPCELVHHVDIEAPVLPTVDVKLGFE